MHIIIITRTDGWLAIRPSHPSDIEPITALRSVQLILLTAFVLIGTRNFFNPLIDLYLHRVCVCVCVREFIKVITYIRPFDLD